MDPDWDPRAIFCNRLGVPNSSQVTRLKLTTGEGSEAKAGAGCEQTKRAGRRKQKQAEDKQERAERNQRVLVGEQSGISSGLPWIVEAQWDNIGAKGRNP
jgi:hypothetical protein